MEDALHGLRGTVSGVRDCFVSDTESFDRYPEETSWHVFDAGSEEDCYTVVLGDDEDDPDAPTLVFIDDPVLTIVRLGTDEVIRLDLPALVGRGTKASARVSNNRAISRLHAIIRQEGEEYLLEDDDSSNGTFVGDARLQPHEAVLLEDGMVFRLADEEFAFHVE